MAASRTIIPPHKNMLGLAPSVGEQPADETEAGAVRPLRSTAIGRPGDGADSEPRRCGRPGEPLSKSIRNLPPDAYAPVTPGG
jgi:hypothetical protein